MAGASVLVVERAPEQMAGGNTRVSAQGYLQHSSWDGARKYISALHPEGLPSGMAEAWADGIMRVTPWLESLGATPSVLRGPLGVADFPELDGASTVRKMFVGDEAGYSHLWELLSSCVRTLQIPVAFESAVRSLVLSKEGVVRGAVVEDRHGTVRELRSRSGVVLCTGGFGAAPGRYCPTTSWLAGSCTSGTPFNTGDGISLAVEAGAALWHMDEGAGPEFAFRHPESGRAVSVRVLGRRSEPIGGMVLVDGRGRRFCDEKRRSHHGLVRSGSGWERQSLPERMFMVFDDAEFESGPLMALSGRQGWPGVVDRQRWSADNLRELRAGWIVAGRDVVELADAIGVPRAALSETISVWNDACANSRPDEYGRVVGRTAFDSSRTFALPISRSLLNTFGGPVRDASGRVVDVGGRPVPGLYAAGELGSIFSKLYQGSSNLAECLVFGRIAARSALAVGVSRSGGDERR